MPTAGTYTRVNYRVWLQAMRVPFYSVGLAPFFMGVALAWNHGYEISWAVILSAAGGVFFIMLATYLLGEYFDFETDRINREFNRFSGGGRAFLHRKEPPKSLLAVALLAVLVAGGSGLLLHFNFRTGPFTIPLGLTGIFCGIFYSTRPLQWAYRGLGEVLIAFCYGWLTVNTGYYLMASHFHPTATLASLPVALSIFNVILINEFPDYRADLETGKRTLVVRCGKDMMGRLYCIVAGAALVTLLGVVNLEEFSPKMVWSFFPLMALGGGKMLLVSMKLYRDRAILEKICGATILFNLLISLFILAAFIIS